MVNFSNFPTRPQIFSEFSKRLAVSSSLMVCSNSSYHVFKGEAADAAGVLLMEANKFVKCSPLWKDVLQGIAQRLLWSEDAAPQCKQHQSLRL
jgi:hypothetical protein